MLHNEHSFLKIGFDTAETEPSRVLLHEHITITVPEFLINFCSPDLLRKKDWPSTGMSTGCTCEKEFAETESASSQLLAN